MSKTVRSLIMLVVGSASSTIRSVAPVLLVNTVNAGGRFAFVVDDRVRAVWCPGGGSGSWDSDSDSAPVKGALRALEAAADSSVFLGLFAGGEFSLLDERGGGMVIEVLGNAMRLLAHVEDRLKT